MSATTNDEVFERLSAPIPPEQIKSRKGSQGRDLLYIQVPTVIDRLDSACGPGAWWNEMEMAEHYVKCRLSIRLPDGLVITREGIGGYPDMPTEEDRVKGGASDSLKRAAALFGIGLSLSEDYAAQQHAQAQPPARQAAPPRRTGGGWGAGQPQGQAPRPPQRHGNGGGNYGPPKTGRQQKIAIASTTSTRSASGWASAARWSTGPPGTWRPSTPS
jgi:hypothetical protein